MKNNILISIIIPMFNAESYIIETISSIIKQDYEHKEIIICDDGSTDNSADIIKELTIKNDSIKYLYQTNSGAPAARNMGLKESKGDYVIFFDSDDIMVEKALTNLIKIINSDDYDLIIGEYLILDENSKVRTKKVNIQNNKFYRNNLVEYEDIVFIDPLPGNKMYKKKYLLENNLFFEDLKIGQDLNLFLRCLGNEPKIKLVENTLFYYRVSNTGISRTFSTHILDIIKSLENVEKLNFPLFKSNPRLLSTLKFNHYSYQLIKVGSLKDKKSKYFAYNELSSRLKTINRKDLVKNYIVPIWPITVFSLNFPKAFLSECFTKIIRNQGL